MLKKHSLGVLAFLIVVLSLFAGLGNNTVQASTISFIEAQVTSSPASQENPDVCGDRIVWQDNVNGNWDIYMYSAWINPWQPKKQITTSTGNDINPKIDNDIIVYQSDRNDNWDIYSYNIATGIETQITDEIAKQENPAVDGNRIVWQDDRNGLRDIYMYDLTTQNETRVMTWMDNYNPDISGDIVVFSRDATVTSNNVRLTLTQVIRVDVSTGDAVLMDQADRVLTADPAIDGPNIVWAHNDGTYPFSGTIVNFWNIQSYNILTGATWKTTDIAQQTKPDVSGESPYTYIVYQDNRNNGNPEIYMYQFVGSEEVRVTNNPATQVNPAIFVGEGPNGLHYNSIVYQDNRNGNWDIYITDFGFGLGGPGSAPPPKPLTPSSVISDLQMLRDDYADTSHFPTSDFAGENGRVKENRRNAIVNQLNSAIESIEDAANAQNKQDRIAYCQNAIDQLTSLLGKTDGITLREAPDVAGSRHTPDWIVGFIAQIYLYQASNSCIEDLQTLLAIA